MHEYDLDSVPPSTRRSRLVTAPARILLAEDDDEMRAMVAGALRDDGFAVDEAADGARLLARLANSILRPQDEADYDAVITDIRMPAASGLSVITSLRRASFTTPVILMTAFGDESVRSRAKELDAVLFDKPFDVDDLRTALVHLLRNQSVRSVAPGEKKRGSVEIASYPSIASAWQAREHLAILGVHATLDFVGSSAAKQEAPIVVAGEVALSVAAAHAELARAILEAAHLEGKPS